MDGVLGIYVLIYRIYGSTSRPAGQSERSVHVIRRYTYPLLLAGLLLLTLPTLAGDAYVDDDNCPGPGAGTLADPFCTIQDGICFLKNSGGGTVHVSPG